VLQVAVACLLGYRWPAELDVAMGLSAESRKLVKDCDALLPFADGDGIVCVPSVNREKPAADRLLELLAAAYGKDWSPRVLLDLLAACDASGKDLEAWLRDLFFEQHCKLFGHRPFVWHVWDGLPGGFSALVNYHGLDKARLGSLVYVYLGGWIQVQEEGVRTNVRGAEQRLAAARELKLKLEKILEGEAPYDIFVRWKSLAQQPLGWEPDLDDGVRMNIRPFMTAGVLRHNKPPRLNVKWDVDRGNDVQSAPWYPVFKGKRVNDHHTTLEEKRKGRGSS
jgi:hypothetical protein